MVIRQILIIFMIVPHAFAAGPTIGGAISRYAELMDSDTYSLQDLIENLETRNQAADRIRGPELDNRNAVGALYEWRPFVPTLKSGESGLSHHQLLSIFATFFNLPVKTGDVTLSRGVRALVDGAFSYFGIQKRFSIILPKVQYPVYGKIAKKNGLTPNTFSTVPHMDFAAIDNAEEKSLLILTSPLSPHGRSLTLEEVNALKEWLATNPERRILLDTVYNFDTKFDSATLSLLETGQVFVAYSLAKSWLLPGHLGILMGGTAVEREGIQNIVEPADSRLMSRALQIIEANPRLPEDLAKFFAKLWSNLSEQLKPVISNWRPPRTGYFSTIPIEASRLLQDFEILGLPLSVFGAKSGNYTVLSVLPNRLEDVYYVTIVSNFSRAYDKYSGSFSKDGVPESTFPDRFYLLTKEELSIGIEKAKRLLEKTGIEGDQVLVVKTSAKSADLLPNQNTGLARYVRSNSIPVENLFAIGEHEEMIPVRLEDIYADSLFLNSINFVPFGRIKPRSISVLPVPQACQACCKFCFSKFSISEEKRKQDGLSPEVLTRAFALAKNKGAERAVITGGGEPTIVGIERLTSLVKSASSFFPGKVTLITNGLSLAKLSEEERLDHLLRLENAGLKTLALSRHHYDPAKNGFIMGIDIPIEAVAATYWKNRDKFRNLNLRLVCVLQKTGVGTVNEVEAYIAWAKNIGISEINFKELYVSTDRESIYSTHSTNIYSEKNRVHLNVLVKHLESSGWTLESRLPWGAPIYSNLVDGHRMQVAAYTEPSVFWERTNGIARSWNLMSDGKLMVSLENGESEISY